MSKTAAATYEERLSEAHLRIARIQKLLSDHAEAQAKDIRNWGYAGDLGHLNSQLAEIEANLNGGE